MKRVDAAEFEKLKRSLRPNSPVAFEVISASMEPLIPVGAKVVVLPFSEAPKIFDIVLFWDGHSEQLVCHFISHLNSIRAPDGGRTLVTQGLRGGEDLPLPECRILGQVVNFHLSWWMRLKHGFFGGR